MNFTKKEILLAMDMKEAGLEWMPEEGDWFADGASTKRLVVMATDKEFSDIPYAMWTYRGGGYSWDARDYIWLPLWHQCREIMQKAGYCLTDVFETTINKITMIYVVYFRDGIEIARNGHTDLEAVYQVVLSALCTADDVEIGNEV